jgi:hypothetical protein
VGSETTKCTSPPKFPQTAAEYSSTIVFPFISITSSQEVVITEESLAYLDGWEHVLKKIISAENPFFQKTIYSGES